MYAVTIPPMNAIFFLAHRPPEMEWPVEEDIDIDVPVNLHAWPEQTDHPSAVLFRATNDPKHYKVFRHEGDVDPAEFLPTGRRFGGFYSRPTWARFLKILPRELALLAIPEDDPPGAADEAYRLMMEAR